MPLNLYLNGTNATALAREVATRLGRPLLIENDADALRAISKNDEFAIVACNFTTWPRGLKGELMNSGMLIEALPDSADALLEMTAKWRAALPYKTTLFKSLLQQCAKASGEFGLFADGDRILVGVSGGEDSLMLMHLLTVLQKRLPFRIEVIPAVIDMAYESFDAQALIDYCNQQNWHLHVDRLDGIQEFFAQNNADDKPCALCSRLRRGHLHSMLATLDCNKLALGHHLDDLCTSFLIALFRGGGLKTMAPNTFADGGKARLIRPLWNCRKATIHQAAQFFNFPKVKSCPYEEQLKDGDRYFLGALLQQLESRFPDIYSAMRHSMGDIRIAHLLDHRFNHLDDPDAGKF